MGSFTDKMFSVEEAYQFEFKPEISLKEFLQNELATQLHQLEDQWVKLDLLKLSGKRTIAQEIFYRSYLERVKFRLEDTIRFLNHINGPRIIQFVCSELLDFLNEYDISGKDLASFDVKNVEHILIVMNGYFQPEVSSLNLTTREEIAQNLKSAVEKLLNRFSGKNREESLKTLSNPSFKEE